VIDGVAVYMLDVGQGDSSIVLLPGDDLIIFDCADDIVLRKILDGWRSAGRGPFRIRAFVLSHLDVDHIAGALAFLRGWTDPIDTVFLSADRDIANSHEAAQRAKQLVDHVIEGGQSAPASPRRWELAPSIRYPSPIASGTGWSVSLLAPGYGQQLEREREGDWEDANRYSAILRVQVGPKAMLIGADAPLLSWSKLQPAELKADVFRIAHHGGGLDDGGVPAGWDVARLYREVGADTVLISVGTSNPHGHPNPLWVGPLIGGSCRLVCTQVTPRCHASLQIPGPGGPMRDDDEIARLRQRVLTTHRGWAEPQYRHLTDRRSKIKTGQPEVPCAGTTLVKLQFDGTITVLPGRGEHAEIIDEWDQPLCR
jgi:beta-lactamase superfamily II metal-dependent hydrolase